MQETWVWSLGQKGSPGEENDNPLQSSSLGNTMDRGAWQATVLGVTKGSDKTYQIKKKKKTKFDQCFLICGQMVLKSSRTILFKKHQPSFSSSQPYAWSSSTKAALKSFFFPLKSRVIFFSFFYWSIIALQCCVAAAVRSLQLCPTLCDPMDCSLPRSSVPGILQARTLEWGAIAFSSMLC